MTVFCDNGDCCYIGEDGFCGCDKLSIVGGVCAGSYRSGRNACDGDVDERLKAENDKLIVKLNVEHIVRQNVEAENAKLRELVRDMYKSMDVSCQFGHAIPAGTMAHVKNRAIGLGVEVDG